MNVQVLFFGATRDAIGESAIEMSFADDTKAATAFDQIIEKYPQLKAHSLLFAVNQEYAGGEEKIAAGDELAVFTAVSGG